MKSFDNYLIEALNTPKEYFLTDDTQIPDQVYGSFAVNGKPYVISLIRTTDSGIYELQLGRVMTNKVMWWRYHSAKDILPALSTLMHFSEASMAFLQGKIKGIKIKLRAPAQTLNRMGRIADRMLNKTFVNSFARVQITQPENLKAYGTAKHAERYMFLVKKGVNPKQLFAGKKYAKYNISSTVVAGEALDEIKPAKKQKQSVTTKPSKKYNFHNYKVDVSNIDDEFFAETIMQVKPVEQPAQEENIDPEETQPAFEDSSPTQMELAGMFAAIMPSMRQSIQKHGYDPKKVKWADMFFALKNTLPSSRPVLKLMGLPTNSSAIQTLDQSSVEGKKAQTLLTDLLKIIDAKEGPKAPVAQPPAEHKLFMAGKAAAGKAVANELQMNSKIKKSPATNKNQIVLKSNIDSTMLLSNLPGQGKVYFEAGEIRESDQKLNDKENHVSWTLQYYNEVANLPSSSYKKVSAYTGQQYQVYNRTLRNVYFDIRNGNKPPAADMTFIKNSAGGIRQMWKAFKTIKPLPEPMWVYRGAMIKEKQLQDLKPGDDYTDAAFMSTSLKAEIKFGGSLKIAIYLPAGASVIPVLSHSQHSTEKEIILPPFSVIKIIEVYKSTTNPTVGTIVGIFMGSAFESFYDQLNSLSENYIIIDNRQLLGKIMTKDKKYDPTSKFSSDFDQKGSQMLSKLVKDGKWKIRNGDKVINTKKQK